MASLHDVGYVLHASHFQESSAIVRLLTRNHGVVSGILRGVYQENKKSVAKRASIQMGNQIECEWSGKASLKTFYRFEQLKALSLIDSKKFICLHYVHELLMYFLRENIPAELVFLVYENFLQDLNGNNIEIALRKFELNLLDDLGYGIDFSWDHINNQLVRDEQYYVVVPGEGVQVSLHSHIESFLGRELIAIAHRDFSSLAILKIAKKINRKILAFHMDNKPIKARAMYEQLFFR